MSKKAVIGSGISGLASAIRLRSMGYEVDLYEQHKEPGGKIAELSTGDFRFDMGPSLFTMPKLVDELFEISGASTINGGFRYKKLDIITRYFYEGGLVIDAFSDPLKFADEIGEKTGEPRRRVIEFLDYSKRIYELTSNVFIDNSLHDPSNYFSKGFLSSLLQFNKIDAFRTMHQANAGWFRDNRIIQLFDRYATYNGSDPYQAPATLNVIPHLEHNIGAYFPEKGMYSIVDSLYKLALNKGVKVHLNTPVEKVMTEKGRISGIMVNGEKIDYQTVVSAIDVHHFYKNLLSSAKRLTSIEKHPRSTSALIFYWAINRQFPDLILHNILFSKNYKEEFDHLHKAKTVYSDPTVYIFISSKEVSNDAPPQSENWFVMINVPENSGQDWDKIITFARTQILLKIKRMLCIDVAPFITEEYVLDPRGIEKRTSSYRGSLYGTSSNSKFAAFARHPNFSREVRGLYFTGGSVHPGGGIPLCLSSAKIVSNLIQRKEGR